MKHKRAFPVGRLIVSLLAAALVATPALAQGQVYLHSVEPNRGQPGQELELALRGGGFGGANEVRVSIGELGVSDIRIESDQVIRVRVFIPPSAQPGPRTIEVIASFGQNEDFSATLAEGFTVLGPEEPPAGPAGPEPPGPSGPEPPGPEPGEPEPWGGGDDSEWPWWLVILVVTALAGLAGVALAVTLTVKARKSSPQKREQAKDQASQQQGECQPGTHKTVREELKLEPGRWKVTELKVTLHDSASDRRGTARKVPSNLVDRIDKATRNELLWGDSEKLAEQAADIGRELTALIVAWQSLSETERDVYLEPKIEGGEATAKFVRYRCVGKPGRWQKESEWEAKLTAVDHFPSTFRGPAADQDPQAYRAQLEELCGNYVRDLIQEAGRLC